MLVDLVDALLVGVECLFQVGEVGGGQQPADFSSQARVELEIGRLNR